MEIVWFFVEEALALPFGFIGGWAYQRYRLWKIKRHAPSAKVATFHVGLTQQDYDGLKKKEDDVIYYTL